MRLIDSLANEYATISLVGMVKNAGKTTLLNELIDQAVLSNRVLGLTTIGHDGEKMDSVTNTPKPLIEVYAGTLIATAKDMLEQSGLKYEVLDVTDEQTAFGPIVIVRMLSAGAVELMGPRSNNALKRVARIMTKWGAELILVDGALDRVSSASPAVADGVFLSTGAALSRDINQVVKQTVHQVKLLGLERINRHLNALEMLRNEEQIGIIDCSGEMRRCDLKTGIGAGKALAEQLTEDVDLVYIPGALTYHMLKTLFEHHSGCLRVVVNDGSKVFIDRSQYALLLSKGLEIKVLDTVNLIGVSVNPVAPRGYAFDAKRLQEMLQGHLGEIPVINVYDA
jgi:GTPase SAR1 family protein